MSKQPLVTISVIHFSLEDGFSVKQHIQPLFESIFAQTYKNVEIYCIDNASTDKEAIQMLQDLPGVEVILLKDNLGTCAHNEVFRRAKGKYLWCVTMDTRYDPDFLEKLVAAAEDHPEGGSFGGALLYLGEDLQSRRIDSLGTGVNHYHSFTDRGHGQSYRDNDPAFVEEVFGISGATVLYSTEALKDIALQDGTVWDERFFMYYEDVDVSYRLQWRGWLSYLVHGAQGRHVRTLAEKHLPGGRIARILLSRGGKSDFHKYYATRNKLWLLMRNFSPFFSWKTKVCTSLEVLGRLAWLTLFEGASRRGVRDALRDRHNLEHVVPRGSEKSAAQRIEKLMRR